MFGGSRLDGLGCQDGPPLVDLHLHQERSARLNQLRAAAGDEPLADWEAWRARLSQLGPGMPRLRELWASQPTPFHYDSPDAMFARFHTTLTEAARVGAILAEVRIGNETMLRAGAADLFRAAEDAVRTEHESFRAGLVTVLKLWDSPAAVMAALSATIASGAGGIDLLYLPYDRGADWRFAYQVAERAAAHGLGVTAHAGEFSASNIDAALALPGLTRIGHAVHAEKDPRLLDLLLETGTAVECCLTSNVVLGAVGTIADHPLRLYRARGIPVVLGTDNPLQFGTTIANEYQVAHSLGLTELDLFDITRQAVARSFLRASERAELADAIDAVARR